MQYEHIGYRIRGCYRVAESGHRREMHPDAQHRLTLLRFREQHGTVAACDAFRISRRTLYRWRRTLRQAHANPAAFIPGSRVPRTEARATPTAPGAYAPSQTGWCATTANDRTVPWPCNLRYNPSFIIIRSAICYGPIQCLE